MKYNRDRSTKTTRVQTQQPTTLRIASVQTQQRHVLLEAIRQYLSWRADKSGADSRGFEVTIFTWFRHYTDFGKTRAADLQSALAPNLNPIPVLQRHFGKDSTLNNHSLDTYLLENILKNKHLFLIKNKFNRLDTEESRAKLQQFILQQQTLPEPEYAYQVGKYFENEKNLQKACSFYALAIPHNHDASYRALEGLAKADNPEAQYLLGFEHYHRQSKFEEAINWCLLASEKSHREATHYLNNTTFSIEHYLMIAKKYELGEVGVAKNITSALYFYEKACGLNNAEAAFSLGQLYNPNLPNESNAYHLKKDAKKAFNYYLIAAKQKQEASLKAMTLIVDQFDDNNLRFSLGEIYLSVFSNPVMALTLFKSLADKQVVNAVNELNKLTNQNPEYAYVVGKLYEEDIKTPNYMQKAYMYYTIGLRCNHNESHEALKRLAIALNSEAQYILAIEYCHRNSLIDVAIMWCILAAEKSHPGAINYLFNTTFSADQYLMLAKKYDSGDGVVINKDAALNFYTKATLLNNKEAAFHLGQFYHSTQSDTLGPDKDLQKAFKYYSIAATQYHDEALKAMENISEDLDDDRLRLSVAQVYLKVYFDPLIALTYLKKLADKPVEAAIIQLNELAQNNSEYALALARLYEDDLEVKHRLQKAYLYYALAIDHTGEYEQFAQEKLRLILISDELTEKELTTIGEMYLTKKDFNNAKQFFELASDKGCEKAFYRLGTLYHYGQGVRKNLITAVLCYELADKKGNTLAKDKLDEILHSKKTTLQELNAIMQMYQNGNGIPKNPAREVLFMQKVCDHGDQATAFKLGQFFQIDHASVPKDNTRAFSFYLKAASLGNPDALRPLERLGEEVSAKDQLALSKLYGTFFHNREREYYWKTKAQEVDNFYNM